MTTATNDYAKFLADKQEIMDLKAARTRCWGAWLKCLGLGVFGSIWQSAVTSNWRPTGIATVVAIPCALLSPADFGVTLAIFWGHFRGASCCNSGVAFEGPKS